MAAASPTPFPSTYGNGRVSRQSSFRHYPRTQMSRQAASRRDSPLSALGQSYGFAADAPMIQRIDIGDSSDEEIPQPMKFSALTRALLEAEAGSPEKHDEHHRRRADTPSRAQAHLRIVRRSPESSAKRRNAHTAAPYIHRDQPSQEVYQYQQHETPAPASRAPSGLGMSTATTGGGGGGGGVPSGSIRVKRVPVGTGAFLRGAPARKIKRTPQGEDEENQPPTSIEKADPLKLDGGMGIRTSAPREKPVPLAPISGNTPRRPAPQAPPPKMTVLETATAEGGANTTKSKRKRAHITVNRKLFTLMGRIGRGGSSEVYRVMAENYRLWALKKVKLDNVDESAVRGYMGEIELLKKLENVDRVVRLIDWEHDEEKNCLSVLMEMGESDLNRLLSARLHSEAARLDLLFTRFYWKEMLECVCAVHQHDIVHSDLKPANFLLVSGRLKLIDFGISNAIETDHTINVHRDSHVGTPNYMSPESIQDTNTALQSSQPGKMMKLGKPSDVWSLGCILYQMVYGRPPFAHIPDQIHRIMAITNPAVTIEYPAVGVGGVKIPPSLKAVLRRCLNRDQTQRPTVEELLAGKDGGWLYPCDADNLPISKELLGQVIQRVAERFRDTRKPPPTDEEVKMYPASFYEKIRELLENS